MRTATHTRQSSLDESNKIPFITPQIDQLTLQSCLDPAIYHGVLPLETEAATHKHPLAPVPVGNFDIPTAYDNRVQFQPYNHMVGIEQHNLQNSIGAYDDPDLTQYSWLLSSNFDVGAVDSALNNTLYEWAQAYPPTHIDPSLTEASLPTNTPPEDSQSLQPASLHQPLQAPEEVAAPSCERAESADPKTETATQGLHIPLVRQWFARLQSDECPNKTKRFTSRAASEDPGEDLSIDERYTTTLSSHLRPRQYEETSLSVHYLNRCLRLYYDRFHPVFPVVHFPTFRSNSRNALLVLSMCSIGSLFIGGVESFTQGYNIYSRLNKAILASWETYLSATPEKALSMLQAALIGQTFGLISSSSHSLIMTDVFQGTMISWARKLGYFGHSDLEWPQAGLGVEAKARAWRSWAHAEQIRRLALALHIHDAELSSLLHHEPLLRHSSVQHTAAVSDALFEAQSAERWYEIIHSFPQRKEMEALRPIKIRDWARGARPETSNSITVSMKMSRFTSYAILENISAAIVEARSANELDLHRRQALTESLVAWARTTSPKGQESSNDYLNLKVLWHSCFMALSTDFDVLERSVGREGQANAASCVGDIAAWASSTDAVRCVFHAIAVKELVETMRLNCTPAIHVPRTLFNAGMALICHQCWRKSSQSAVRQQEEAMNWDQLVADFPEFRAGLWPTRNKESQLCENLRQRVTSYYPNALYGILELLQRLDKWSISSCFADVLQEASFESL